MKRKKKRKRKQKTFSECNRAWLFIARSYIWFGSPTKESDVYIYTDQTRQFIKPRRKSRRSQKNESIRPADFPNLHLRNNQIFVYNRRRTGWHWIADWRALGWTMRIDFVTRSGQFYFSWIHDYAIVPAARSSVFGCIFGFWFLAASPHREIRTLDLYARTRIASLKDGSKARAVYYV